MVVLTNFPPPTEGIIYKQNCTFAHIGAKSLGKGTLYIAESRLSWMGENEAGFSLEYPAINLHAVSRDVSSFPHECLYLMVDGNLLEDDEQCHSSSSEEDNDDESPTTEIRFVPEDKGTLDALFSAMSDCQALHPDENADSDLNEDDDQYFVGEEGLGNLTEEGQATMDRLEGMLIQGGGDATPATNGTAQDEAMEQESGSNMEVGQFEDADIQ